MGNCFHLKIVNCAGGQSEEYVGAWDDISTSPGGCGVFFVLNGQLRSEFGSNQSVQITRVDCSLCGNPAGCQNPSAQYDCINGACVKNSAYNTPGLYPTLSDCEIACGTGCSGKCISNADWAQIEGLSKQLKNKNCS